MRGGKRVGAGRPIGTKNVMSSKLAKAAAAAGITPVEMMICIARTAFAEGDTALALDAASKVAPYTSPRLSSVAVNMEDFSEQQLRKFID